MYEYLPRRPSSKSHRKQVSQDRISSALFVFLGYPYCASGANSTVTLSCGGAVYTLAHLFDSLYALTLGKKQVAAFFSTITLAQFTMGMYMVGVAAGKPGA